MRKEIIDKGLKKTLDVIDRMMGHRDIDDVKELVKITDELYLEVNCFRVDTHDPFFDFYGEAISFEIYAIKNNESVDCVTINTFTTESFKNDVGYLLNCYV